MSEPTEIPWHSHRPSDDGRRACLRTAGVIAVEARLASSVIDAFPAADVDDDLDALIDGVIAAIDDAVARVVDAILHAPGLQRLEAAWRGLAYTVERTDFDENIEIAVWSCTKGELARDLNEASELPRSAAFAHVYTAEFGQFGGRPYAAILADMTFDASPADVQLLRKVAALAAMAHAPFFAAASPRIFGTQTWQEFAALRDRSAPLDSPRMNAWNALRTEEDARYVGLLLPRFLLRQPYVAGDSNRFTYAESIGTDAAARLWGNPVFAFATRLAASFARYRTMGALLGSDDSVDAPVQLHGSALGQRVTTPAVEILVTPKVERELRHLGLIALVHDRDSGALFVSSANSLQQVKRFGGSPEGMEATLNYRLGTKFPYLFLACRVAHYIKVIERETTGSQRSVEDVELALNEWIGEYVVDMDSASPSIRARYPLRRGAVKVRAIDGTPGWYRADISLRPHLKYLGTSFTLSVSSLLERAG